MAENFLRVNCKNKECVDPYLSQEDNEYQDGYALEKNAPIKQYIEENILTYKMTSDDFFAQLPEDKKYDVVFIDGLHTEEQAGRDIVNSLNHLNNGGFIVVHDCLPDFYEAQTDVRNTGVWNGSTWRAIPMLRFAGIPYFTVDTDFGCCVIHKVNDETHMPYLEKAPYDYNDVFSSIPVRNIVMSVISEEQFMELLNNPL